MIKLSKNFREEIREAVYLLADNECYLSMTRPDSSKFMNQLLGDPRIGGRLASFMSRDVIKTYIKDGILNRYSKERSFQGLDLQFLLKTKYGQDAKLTVRKIPGHPRTMLFSLDESGNVVVNVTTFRKWETGLRYLILYAANNSAVLSLPKPVKKALVICPQGGEASQGERTAVERALCAVQVDTIWGR